MYNFQQAIHWSLAQPREGLEGENIGTYWQQLWLGCCLILFNKVWQFVTVQSYVMHRDYWLHPVRIISQGSGHLKRRILDEQTRVIMYIIHPKWTSILISKVIGHLQIVNIRDGTNAELVTYETINSTLVLIVYWPMYDSVGFYKGCNHSHG